jgi:hypothetical protein
MMAWELGFWHLSDILVPASCLRVSEGVDDGTGRGNHSRRL